MCGRFKPGKEAAGPMAQATKLFDLSAGAVFAPAKQPAGAIAEQTPLEGPRKLVRPRLPEHLHAAPAPRRLRGPAPLASHDGHILHGRGVAAANHAEAFYFHKQMQAQTPMVFVLEDGERIRGVVEWFDRDTIKVRNSTRTLIFKQSIKYLYKAAGDFHP